MDMIDQVSDDLLLRILSLVPIKDIPTISLVSKRWHSLSSLVTRLEYNDINHYNDDADYKSFTQFVYRSLLLNKAPVLKKLNLYLGPKCRPVDIGIWIDTAVARNVRELGVVIRKGSGLVNLPRSLYTCKTLQLLNLQHCLVSDVLCLPSLRSLGLVEVECATSLSRVLSGCPNLGGMYLAVRGDEQGKDITVEVPSLKKLCIRDGRNGFKGRVHVLATPRLELVKIIDDVVYDCRRIENMPDLVKAHVEITQGVSHKFLRAFSSACSLHLGLTLLSEATSMNTLFYRLVHLELSTCAQGWWDLLTHMLQISPKLTSLKLTDEHRLQFPSHESPECWKKPSSIPQSLETFAWTSYQGRRGDLEMATYVIKNATHLKTATFSPQSNDDDKSKYMMLKDLVSLCTPSPTCQLRFH